MNDNDAMIIVHPTAIEVVPTGRKVLAGIEPFKLGIDWSNNHNTWEFVTVKDFKRVRDDSDVEIDAPAWFRKDERFVKQIRFRSIEHKTGECDYRVVCEGFGKPMERILQVLLVAPEGGTDAGPSTEGEEREWRQTTPSSTYTRTSSSCGPARSSPWDSNR